MNPRTKYLLLASRAFRSSIDYGRGVIYNFVKYCKQCGEALNPPPKLKKNLWRKSYCCEECLEDGPRKTLTFPIKVNPDFPSPERDYPQEEMAFLALEIARAERKTPVMVRLIRETFTFRLLAEKLRYLEVRTGEVWNKSKYYYHLSKIEA